MATFGWIVLGIIIGLVIAGAIVLKALDSIIPSDKDILRMFKRD